MIFASNNYITVMGWMAQSLNLNSNELLCYALIYGFSQDGKSEFSGSISYIQGALNISKASVIRILQSLCEKGLIRKVACKENNIAVSHYVCIDTVFASKAKNPLNKPSQNETSESDLSQNDMSQNETETSLKMRQADCLKMRQADCLILTPNNTIYNINNKLNNINTHTHENAREEENGVGDSREDFYSGILSEFLSNDIRLEAFCMNNHTSKIEFERIGKEIINEWMIAPPSSVGRNDVSRHLLASIKKRIKDNGTNSTGAKPQYKSPQDREAEEFARQRRAMAAELAEIEKRHAAGDYGIGWDYSPVDRNRLFNDLQPELTDGTGECD